MRSAPDEKARNNKESLRIATKGLESARRREPLFLDTMAAAHADAGRFKEALVAQREAVELAGRLGDAKLKAELEKRIAAYEGGKPYRQQAATATVTSPAMK